MGLLTKMNQTVRQIIYTFFCQPRAVPSQGVWVTSHPGYKQLIGLILSWMLFVFSTPADTDNSQSDFVVDDINSVEHPGTFY